ncbi:TIR domain-containing protein [Sporosarcina globispora]|uniref:TIR domain-containing protein n=1 Tax=Sporosarcina globispora TaxID=1459 RepID=UPI0006A97F89|nr:TIR domain-containing protein [Sporosarcina globispora]
MKVFLSWSGDLSRNVALILRDWIPSVIQSVEPYVSSEDIDKGTRWSSDIAGELNNSNYGIIILTKENIKAPWINFEAGALSKQVEKSRVSPFLFNLKRSEVTGPTLQFQSTIYTKDDVKKLVESINKSLQSDALEQVRLDKVFEVWWPSLKEDLDALLDAEEVVEVQKTEASETNPYTSEILEELLELARNQQKLLRSPTELLPPQYLSDVIQRSEPIPLGAIKELNSLSRDGIIIANELISNLNSEEALRANQLENILNKISDLTYYMEERRVRRVRPKAVFLDGEKLKI